MICRPSAQKSTMPVAPASADTEPAPSGSASCGRRTSNQPPSAAPPKMNGRVDEDAAEEEDPEAEGVEPGEGDVAGADLQRERGSCTNAAAIGMTKRKIIVVPCIVNSWL